MNTGEVEWMSSLGDGPRNHPALSDLDLPRLGWPLHGTLVVTKTLLVVGQGAILPPILKADTQSAAL